MKPFGREGKLNFSKNVSFRKSVEKNLIFHYVNARTF